MTDTFETPEELLAELKRRGVLPGQWAERGGHKIEPEFVKQQKELLLKTQDMLKGKLTEDQHTLEHLRQVRDRLKHGGGS